MLKGLKLKTKLPDKDTNAAPAQVPQPARMEEEQASSTQGKRWMKPSDNQSRGEPVQQNKLSEDDLIKTCKDIWESYINGQIEDAEKSLKDLKKKETRFYENKKQETVIVNKNIEEREKEEDIFASVEKTALRNFDPKKSAYLITDIMSDTIKTKGKTADDEVYKMYRKKGLKTDPDNLYDEEYDLKEGEEEKENKKKSKKDRKIEQKEKRKEAMEAGRVQRVLATCRFCLNNNQIMEEQILSFSPNALLLIPEIRKYKADHFYIIPIEHVPSQIEIEDDQYDELKNYMKCLVSMYDKKDYGVAFMETYINVEKSPHCIIEAVAMPREKHDELPLYFKKALNELESEWATHKKIIEIKKEKGGIRKQIPKGKGFPFFYIDFDTAYGYAHVIEKTKEYNPNFAHEIIGSILEVDKNMTMAPKRYERRDFARIKEDFQEVWNEYDWTKMV